MMIKKTTPNISPYFIEYKGPSGTDIPITKDVIKKNPKHLKATIYDALKHARRKGEDISEVDDRFFED